MDAHAFVCQPFKIIFECVMILQNVLVPSKIVASGLSPLFPFVKVILLKVWYLSF